MTNNLYSHRAWLEYYESKAAEVPYHIRTNPPSFQSTLLGISRAALDSRAKDLRSSDSYMIKKIQTAAAGVVPILKFGISIGVSDTFVDEALLAFGLSDRPGLEDLAKQLKATSCGRDDIPMDILMTFARLGKAELLAHLGAYAAGETVHCIPGIGQITSMATGYVMQRKRLIAIIKKTRAEAEKVHTDLFIPVVVHNTRIIPSLPAVDASPTSIAATKRAPSLPAVNTSPATIAATKRAFSTRPAVPPSRIVAKRSFTLKRVFFEIHRAFFDICMSLLALLTWELLSILYKYMDADVSPQKYFGFLVTGLVLVLLSRYVRAFRVMFVSNILGIASLQIYYQNFGPRIEAEGDRFLVACIATFAGFWILRM